MKEWVEFSKCAGKTIAAIDTERSSQWALLFTDGSWSTLQAISAPYDTGFDLCSPKPDGYGWFYEMKRLGIDTSGLELAMQNEQRKREEAAVARERADYERLHAKFGKGEV
ncbi:MAG: hypothetical protein IPP12_22175 [Nitrospira sp.]|nr:hypothetical protein [Nitrospira sp.]